MSSSITSTKPSSAMRIRYSCPQDDSWNPGTPTDYQKIQRPRQTLLRFSSVVTWLYFLQSIFETKNYSREKICRNCRLSVPNYVLNIHQLDQVYRSPVPECCLEESTPYLPSKEPVLHYTGSKDHLISDERSEVFYSKTTFKIYTRNIVVQYYYWNNKIRKSSF